MVPSGTSRPYDTYTSSNKYVLWFIWKLSDRQTWISPFQKLKIRGIPNNT